MKNKNNQAKRLELYMSEMQRVTRDVTRLNAADLTNRLRPFHVNRWRLVARSICVALPYEMTFSPL